MKLSSVLLSPIRQLRQPWPNHIRQFDYLDWETQRRVAYRQIDKGGFGYWTLVVAGIGFLTDAYDIFAVNTVIPMINVVYFGGRLPAHHELLINLAVLVGTFLSQIIVGVLADRYGRKRLYGIELVLLTTATVFVAVTSKGALRSTNKLGWIVAWRFLMGLGIGGDYPLSAVITAEFAPRKHRARMLATVFFMQPVGALLANVVSVSTVLILRGGIPLDARTTSCTGDCAQTVDQMWRWIVGLGAVPPAFAIFLRWWIPESPRYSLEVEMDPVRASRDVKDYWHTPVSPGPDKGSQYAADVTCVDNFSPGTVNTESTLAFGEPVPMKDFSLSEPALSINTPNDNIDRSLVRKETWAEFWTGFKRYFIHEGNWPDLAGTAIAWLVLDFAFYLLGVNSPRILGKLWSVSSYSGTPVHEMLLENGYRALIANSTGAVLGGALFIAFASWRWHLQLYGFCVLAVLFVLVGVCFVTLINTKYAAAVIVLYACCNLFFNFGPNTSTFTLTAEVFPTKYRCTAHGLSAAAGKLGSILAQIFLTYAKFGGVGAAAYPSPSNNYTKSTWLGWVLLIFSAWMLVGALVTAFWVPNPSNIWGQSRTLEELAMGRKARRGMERKEREAWGRFVPGSPNGQVLSAYQVCAQHL